jgi:excisionase family DNA binding protein
MTGLRNTTRAVPHAAPEPIYTIPQIAESLGVCTKTVRREIGCGALKAIRVGRQFRITSGAYAAYLSRRSY